MFSFMNTLSEVVLDGPRAEEQPGADLDVRLPTRHSRDLRFLGGEFVARLGRV
jgi:hypothetical protein